MKNAVVEIDEQYAVVLTDSGDFKRIANTNNLKVGDVFLEKARNVFPRIIKMASTIAAVFILGFMASFYYLSYTPHGYIDVRINPGIKITLNAMDKVIAVDGLNDDGKLLLANLTQKESDPQKTLELIVSKAIEMGFFKEGNPVRITVAIKNSDKVASMENSLMETAQNTLRVNSVDVPVSAFSIDVQDYKSLESDRNQETADTQETAGIQETADTTDYSPAWKEKTVKPSICDVKFGSGNIIIEFNHNLTLDNVIVYAYSDKNPSQKLEAKIIDSKNDKLTVSFVSLAPGETYKLEVAGITTKDGVQLDPITAKIIQPANKVKNATDEAIPTDSVSTDPKNNGNGNINGSNNGNNRNEDGNGNANGKANGLETQNPSDTDLNSGATPVVSDNAGQQNGNGNSSNKGNYSNGDEKGNVNANGLQNKNTEQEQEKLQEQQQQQQEREQGQSNDNQNGNTEQNRNENINKNQSEDKNGDKTDSEDSDKSVPAPKAMIKSVDLAEGAYKITFNIDLSLEGVKVTATQVTDTTKILTGQATVSGDHTLLVSFTSLVPNTEYVIQVENASLKDGTMLEPLKVNYQVRQDDKTNHGN